MIKPAQPGVVSAWTIDDDQVNLPISGSTPPDLDKIESQLPDGWVRVGDTFVNVSELIAFVVADQ